MGPSNSLPERANAAPAFAPRRTWAGRRQVATCILALTFMGTSFTLAVTTTPAWASVTTLYAYAHGQATSPTNCPKTSSPSRQCTLGEALSMSVAGSTLELATPSRAGDYVGNWVVSTPGTTSSAPLTIKAAAGTTGPTLDGNHGDSTHCSTQTCDGPVLTIGRSVHLDLDAVTVQNADNTTIGLGGAIENIHGGVVRVSHAKFLRNYANADGGAIDNADNSGTGTLTVLASTFSENYAVNGDGGAIANADVSGKGTVVVSGSTFSTNSAINGNGGAIDNGDTRGKGSLMVSGSTFSGNVAGRAGAIDNGDNAVGTLNVSTSTFSNNVAALDDGGAIDNAGWGGTGTAAVSASTFRENKTIGDGGAIDSADNIANSRGTLVVSTSTFFGNIADVHGGAIDNADGGQGTLSLSASTFSANNANNIYSPGTPGGGAVNGGSHGAVWVVADIFNGPCSWAGATWNDEGYNIGRNASCLNGGKGDVGHGASMLSRIGYHGGPTQTIVPLKGNPAIGAIPYKTTVGLERRALKLCPSVDQRKAQNRSSGDCNAGAVQSGG